MAKAVTKRGGGKKPGTALVSMRDLEGYYVDESAAAKASAPAGDGAPRIGTSDGMFRVGDTQLPDPLEVIVVAETLLNVYYDSEYDPQQKSPPACFALAASEKGAVDAMRAHPTSPNVQGGANDHDCATCEMNRFGSAEKGKGKACANTRQLAVVMADDAAFSDGGELRWAVLPIAPTGLTAWGKYVTGLTGVVRRPPWGVVTKFSFNKKDPVEARRKAVVALGYKLIDDVGVAVKVKELRAKLLADGALLRPLPVGDYVKPGERGKKGAAADAKAGKKAAAKPKRKAA